MSMSIGFLWSLRYFISFVFQTGRIGGCKGLEIGFRWEVSCSFPADIAVERKSKVRIPSVTERAWKPEIRTVQIP